MLGNNRVIAVVGVALLACMVCLAGCAKDACEGDTLTKAVEASAKVAPDRRTELMSQALLDACVSTDEPMPPSLRAALSAVREYDTFSAPPVVMRAIKDDPSLWLMACARGTAALKGLGWGNKAALELARACGTEHLTFATEGDFARSRPLGTLLAVLAWPWLSTKGTDKTRAHSVAVALMGTE